MAIQRDKVIANAEKLVAKGKIEPAIKEYERLLEDSPGDVNTLNRIGDLWVRINRNDEAVKTFGRIADHYAKDGFFLKAIAIYKKINKLDPSKLDVYAKLADLYAKQGLAMEAKSQYQVLADYYLKHGDPGNSLLIYRKIAELDPNAINVHVKLADLYSQNNNTAEALKEYDRVGRMLLKRGMLDEAVQVFRKALKIDAKNLELVESLVTALVEAKDYNNAQQIVETALETNKNSPRLLATWARILLGKGDVNSAKSSLERGLASDPNDPSIREVLGDLYLKQNNADKALEMLAPLVERALSRGERAAAVEIVNKILKIDASHTPTLERMVALYTRLNEETNVLASMNSLAEAHIAKGSYEQAAAVLEKLIQREPQNAQHRNKLQFVRSQTGGLDSSGGRAGKAAPPPPPPPPSLSMPDLEIEEESISFEPPPSVKESTKPAELDFTGFADTAPTSRSSAPEMEIAPLEAEQASDDLDFITEHLTEAEVFAKYGLAEKAAEHLRAVIDRAPKHVAAYDKLYRIQLDEGDVDDARVTANQYVALLQEKSDSTAIDAVKNEFISRGHSLSGQAKRAPTIEKPVPKFEPEMEFEPEMDLEPELEVETEAPAEHELTLDVSMEEEQPGITFDEPSAGEPSTEEPFFGVEALGAPEAVELPPPPAPNRRAPRRSLRLLRLQPAAAPKPPPPPPPPVLETHHHVRRRDRERVDVGDSRGRRDHRRPTAPAARRHSASAPTAADCRQARRGAVRGRREFLRPRRGARVGVAGRGRGGPARRGGAVSRRDLQGVQEGRRTAARQRGLRHPLQPRHRLQGDGTHRRGDRRISARLEGFEARRGMRIDARPLLPGERNAAARDQVVQERPRDARHQRRRASRSPLRPRSGIHGGRRCGERPEDVHGSLRDELDVSRRQRAHQAAGRAEALISSQLADRSSQSTIVL